MFATLLTYQERLLLIHKRGIITGKGNPLSIYKLPMVLDNKIFNNNLMKIIMGTFSPNNLCVIFIYVLYFQVVYGSQ